MNVEPKTPLTSVKVLRSIPFDNTYSDVMDFSNTSNQISFFTSKAKETFTNITPISVGKNQVRLPKPADYFYDCNYIMFQNANFSTKWFYAFISEVEYVNVNSSIIHFEIDVFQSWLFDRTLKESYVEREHSAVDYVGSNLVTENMDIGTYREEPAESSKHFNSYVAVIGTSFDPSLEKLGGYYGGLFTGLSYVPALVDNPTQVDALIDLLDKITKAGKSDAITSIFMMPSDFYTNDSTPVNLRVDAIKQQSSIGSYIPKNKKLLTYPYNFLYAYTPEGSNAIFKYEYFQGDSCGFLMSCAMSCNPEIIAQPIAYQNQQFNCDEYLTLSGFPQCSYSIDSFKAFLAQNSTSTLISLGSSALGMMSGNPMAVAGGMMGMASTVNSVVQASIKPPMAKGTQGNSTFTGTRQKNFYFVNKHISEEYARIIDDYFSMFGYATNKVKVPNTNSRPSWNYIKTKDIKITGSIPFGDMAKLKDIFNKGVTIWHGDFIGEYSRNNQP